LNFPSFFRSSYIFRRIYGFRDGFRIALQVRRAQYVAEEGTLVSVDVPGLCCPINLRARTADAAVFSQIFGDRELEIGLPSQPRFIVDAGAHIGLSSIWLSQRFPGATIVSLEVESSNFSLLKMNTASYKDIIPLHKALWWEKAELEIQDPAEGNWGFRVNEDPAEVANRVQSLGVSDILHEFNRNTIDLLKMDIEGAELEVFSNDSESWIDQVSVIAVESHERFRPGCLSAIRGAIAGRGFSERTHGEYTVLTQV
jgi:FkbM family methyltransferase